MKSSGRYAFVTCILTNGVHARMPSERQAIVCHRVITVLLKTLIVCGHADVSNTQLRTETIDIVEDVDNHKQLATKNEYVVDSTGGSLVDFMASLSIDWYRCYSNDVHEVQSVLGISAAAKLSCCGGVM